MKPAPIPKNEAIRQAALDEYDIVDSLPERIYDDITALASEICGTPVALISFIDNDRQWFKSKVGVDAPETPRDVSFCGHAINLPGLFVVPDAETDQRFADNPFVTSDFGLRFYAGAPLRTPEGHSIGTLCVIDRKARELTPSQLNALEALARQVVSLLELRKSNRELKKSLGTIADQQERLVASAKMSAVGTMAGGVAHEINNPLAIICAKADVLLEQIESGDFDRSYAAKMIGDVKRTSLRIAKIVKGLLAVSRSDERIEKSVCSVRELMDEALGLASERYKRVGIEVRLDASLESHKVVCGSIQVTQVLLNLLNNAYDAVETLQEKWIEVRSRSSGDAVEILFTDSGRGIPPEIRGKIMEPFFTTKSPGKGTGLGLSISKRMLESQGGGLELVRSSSNTTFKITLPAEGSVSADDQEAA